MKSVKLSILTAGYCTCPEHIAIQDGRWKNIRFPAMFVLFEHPYFGAMLFDTGYSQRFFQETRRFPNRLYRMITPVSLRQEDLAVEQLARLNISPSDITRVFISHFHADHIAALADFPRAKYVYLPRAYDSIKDLRGWGAVAHGHLPGLIPADFSERAAPVRVAAVRALPPEFAPFTRGFDLLGDDSLLAVELPGHAAGQMGLLARDESGQAWFFVADAAWLGRSISQNQPPHRLANFLFPDPAVYRETLAGLQRLQIASPDVRLVPSHCESTLAQYARKW